MNTLNRTVLKANYPWLPRDLPEGTRVYGYHGPLYADPGMANFSPVLLDGYTGYYFVPNNAINQIELPIRRKLRHVRAVTST